MRERVVGLHCPDIGRPPFDPSLILEGRFIGYLLGSRSERHLVRKT
jgi:hypothetical protein